MEHRRARLGLLNQANLGDRLSFGMTADYRDSRPLELVSAILPSD